MDWFRELARLTAGDLMSTDLVTVGPDMSIVDVIRVLVEARVSGAPVIEDDGTFCGVVSEYDCLRIMTAGEYSSSVRLRAISAKVVSTSAARGSS